MEYKTIHKTQAQINADRANFYFAHRALNAGTFFQASDFQRTVPELTWAQANALAAAMASTLNSYRAEAEKNTEGKVGKIIWE